MVSAIGSTGIARAVMAPGEKRAGAAKATAAAEADAPALAPTAAAQLVAAGAPVDAAKVAAVRARIADGSYRLDPAAIAARMIALDLPA